MSHYDTPLTFKSGITIANRLIMSPMTTQQSFYNGTVTRDEIQYYVDRAKGLGAVITGAANVQALGKGWPGELSIASDDMLPQLHALASAIQAQGAKAIVQIFHAGRMTHEATLGGVQPVSASAVAALRPDAEVPRAMTIAEIHETVQAFGQATRRAIEAGFDGVELHGANTYLLQQFFSPHSNRRTDEYGGTREKRYRFVDEVLQSVFAAVKQYAKRPFLVGYRVSPEEFETPGIRFDDTLWLLDQLKVTDLDYVHLSLKDYSRVSRDEQHNQQSMLAYAHNQLAGKLPLIGVGGVRTRADVTAVLENAELVAVGQQLLYDPTWAVKLATGADDAMLQVPFKEAVKFAPLSTPLHDFAASFYTR
ncbi:NADH-dependent flavin oxidoreductase [Lacticaseibacillus porcinae]|uniref:NADH-dependent flavin oxidoreductase n=1 Tax=Lacticaseibacillus porcinae TaxID=1123687 RepID=UPI000F773D8E|nr:NADH-dependent flavin oxidoreductase [Lacticaseibacillus porcinae]